MGERIPESAGKQQTHTSRVIRSREDAHHTPGATPPASRILSLQRTIGNQAVQQLIFSRAVQAKLRISQPGDIHEQEADRVAEEVMRMPKPGAAPGALITSASQETQTPAGTYPCRECGGERRTIPRKGSVPSSSVTSLPPMVLDVLNTPGQPLDPSSRAFFEPRLGMSLHNVRIHADRKAGEASRAMDAQAYTVGRDIVFDSGLYNTGTREGKRLLAHELVHVVQQADDQPISLGMSISTRRDVKIQLQASKIPLEKEEKLAEKAVAEGMYLVGRLLMDEEGWAIADRWLQGKTDEVVLVEGTWKNYLMKDKKLKKEISDKISEHARSMEMALARGFDRLDGNLKLQFHGEVGSKEGGFFTGYDLLHGTNENVGDFQINGNFSIHRSRDFPGMTIAYYKNLEFVFNDIVDLNKKYYADVLFGRIGKNIARAKGTGPPKDYTIRIKWHADFQVISQRNRIISAGYPEAVGSKR